MTLEYCAQYWLSISVTEDTGLSVICCASLVIFFDMAQCNMLLIWRRATVSRSSSNNWDFVCLFVSVCVCVCVCSTLAAQRTCEEGGVEPEAATGGDCSDDTLHAGNGDTQQYVHISKTILLHGLLQSCVVNCKQGLLVSYQCSLSCLRNSAKKGMNKILLKSIKKN